MSIQFLRVRFVHGHRLGLLLLVISAVLVTGCGDGRPTIVPVTGKVLFNGEPLTGYNGFVRVEPIDSRASIGQIDSNDGSFTLTTFEKDDGCVPGQHPVAVIVNISKGADLISIIPVEYSNVQTSNLSVDISDTPNTLTIELEGKLNKVKSSARDLEGDEPGI